MIRKARQSNIELLRVIAAMGVIILHFNGRVFQCTAAADHNLLLAQVTEVLFIGAVDLFLIIFGFFQCEKESVTLYKPLALLAQVSLFKGADYFLCCFLTNTPLSLAAFLQWLVPTNYFVDTYVAVLLVSPYVNKLLNRLSYASFRKLIIVCAALFAILPCFVDQMYLRTGNAAYLVMSVVSDKGALDGYTFVNYLFMYLIGAFIRRRQKEKGSIPMRLALLFFSAATFCELGIMLLKRYLMIQYSMIYAYNSPFVIMMAVSAFLLFQQINLGTKSFINRLAQATFIVYLAHPIILRYVPVETFAEWSFPLFAASMAGTAVSIYGISFLLFLVVRLFGGFVGKWFSGTKLANVLID